MTQNAKKLLTSCKKHHIIKLRLEVDRLKDLNQMLSEYIKLERFKSKLSQEEVAKKIGITRQAYTRWEANPIKLNLEQLEEISIALNTDLFIFFNNIVAKSND